MLTSLIVTPTHSPQIQMAVSIILEQIKDYLFLPGTIITSTKSIFVYKETATIPLNCTSQRCLPFIGASSITPPTDVNSCSAYTLI
jgi:hypothetical protein